MPGMWDPVWLVCTWSTGGQERRTWNQKQDTTLGRGAGLPQLLSSLPQGLWCQAACARTKAPWQALIGSGHSTARGWAGMGGAVTSCRLAVPIFPRAAGQGDAGFPLGGRQPLGTVWGVERQGEGGLSGKIKDFLFLAWITAKGGASYRQHIGPELLSLPGHGGQC